MNTSRTINFVRRLATECAKKDEQVPERILRLRENQKKFGVDDGTPIYLKGGAGDKALFGTTVALVGVGLIMSLHTFYKITFKD